MINIADVNLYYFLPEFLHICGKMIFNNKFKMIIIFLLKQSSKGCFILLKFCLKL